MSKKVVAVLFGGQSSEHEISKISASTIISNLSQDKYYIMPVYITKEGRWKIYDGPVENINNGSWEKYATHAILSPDTEHKGLLRIVGDKIKNIPIDIVFPVLHGKYGEDGTIQGMIELTGLPYVGCGVIASSISMDKSFTKIIADSIGVEQAKYIKVYRNELENFEDIKENINKNIGYPCFIKPANAGSSVGITKAFDDESLKQGLEEASKHDRTIVIEQSITGREVECAVIGNEVVKASCVGEVLSASDFYDFDSKYTNKESKTVIPAQLDENISEKIREYAVKIFKAVDGCGLARVDFFVEENTNRVIFNEINTMPGFTDISMYHMLWAEMGIKLPELLDELIELGFKRYER